MNARVIEMKRGRAHVQKRRGIVTDKVRLDKRTTGRGAESAVVDQNGPKSCKNNL